MRRKQGEEAVNAQSTWTGDSAESHYSEAGGALGCLRDRLAKGDAAWSMCFQRSKYGQIILPISLV